jgi:hypothetical protein
MAVKAYSKGAFSGYRGAGSQDQEGWAQRVLNGICDQPCKRWLFRELARVDCVYCKGPVISCVKDRDFMLSMRICHACHADHWTLKGDAWHVNLK